MSSTASSNGHGLDLTDEDQNYVAGARRALNAAIELRRWWERVDAANEYSGRFKEAFVYNRPEDRSFGFFETADLAGGRTKVIGNVQEQLYHRPKAGTADLVQKQIREFVLRYFMRVSVFRTPQPEPETSDAPWPLSFLSQFPGADDYKLQGFGYSQRYYKEKDGGKVGKFPESERLAITDIRDMKKRYEWVMIRNPIVDFAMNIRPLGVRGPDLILPIPSAVNWLVMSPDTVTIDENPGDGVLGRYGIGYAFMRDPGKPGLFAYGPGQLEPALQLIVWEVKENGDVVVRMTFASGAPKALLNVSANPLDWGFQAAELMTAGVFTKYLQPVRDAVNMLPLSGVNLHPIYPAVRALNRLTFNFAGEKLGISTSEINKTLTYVHFVQHYNAVQGSRQTWEQFPDWSDEGSLPDWVKNGNSAGEDVS